MKVKEKMAKLLLCNTRPQCCDTDIIWKAISLWSRHHLCEQKNGEGESVSIRRRVAEKRKLMALIRWKEGKETVSTVTQNLPLMHPLFPDLPFHCALLRSQTHKATISWGFSFLKKEKDLQEKNRGILGFLKLSTWERREMVLYLDAPVSTTGSRLH